MNPEQEEFMEDVIDEMEDRISTKFPEGAKKYKTVLHKDHNIAFLHEMAMDELTDLPTYMIALNKRLDDAREVLRKGGRGAIQKALKILG